MEPSFLDFEFSPIELKNRKLLADFLNRHPQPLSGFTFATLAAWHSFFRYGWVFAEPEALLISCFIDPDSRRHMLQPVGPLSSTLKQGLLKGAVALSYPLKIIGVCDRFLEENPDFARQFQVEEDRAISNYVYQTSALARLPGRKYAKKRNLLAQAASLYSWSCRTLTAELVDLCFAVLVAIMDEERPQVQGMLQRELAALECTLRHFEEFCQQGLLISVNGRPVAFSVYETISPTTAAIHFERALRSYKGLYQVINWETAKVIAEQGIEFINREEDMGDAGLRDAKLSYHPAEIVPAYELTFRK